MMKMPHLYKSIGACSLCALLFLNVNHAVASPHSPPSSRSFVKSNCPDPGAAPVQSKLPRLLSSLVLNYDQAGQNSDEVLSSKVTVSLKDASFLAALEGVMNASDKTCRVECRQVHPLRISLNVQNATVAGLLDSLAKLSGTRLYVLPSKLILAPEAALTADEKKSAKLYGVLLTATTLPNTTNAKALAKTDAKTIGILDIANTKINVDIKDAPLYDLLGGFGLKPVPGGDSSVGGVTVFGPFSDLALKEEHVTASFQNVNFGDALASIAHLAGFELYITHDHFIMCSPDNAFPELAKQVQNNAVPAFTPQSTRDFNPSVKES